MTTDRSEERTLMRDSIAKLLARRYPFERHRAVAAGPQGFDRDLWCALAEDLAVLGAPFPAELGGLDGSLEDVIVVMEELGRVLAAEPYFGSVVLGGQFLARSNATVAQEVLHELIAGNAFIAVAQGHAATRRGTGRGDLLLTREGDRVHIAGEAEVVYGAPWATHLIVIAGNGRDGAAEPVVALIESQACAGSLRAYRTIDGGYAADLRLDGIEVPASCVLASGAAARELIEFVLDYATVAQCAEGVGLLRELCVRTIEYARDRRQFGQSIASYQVIRHRIVDMDLELEESIASTALACSRFDADPDERSRLVAAAKWCVGRACRTVGESAIQIHGAIGTTDELALGHYFKRALVVSRQLGTADDHRKRWEQWLLRDLTEARA
jgi:alkylation response protein AidB-like acyl-CoA dehydrogenase